MNVELPSSLLPYVDKNGRLTLDGVKFLQRIVEALRDHEDRLAGGGL